MKLLISGKGLAQRVQGSGFHVNDSILVPGTEWQRWLPEDFIASSKEMKNVFDASFNNQVGNKIF